MSRKQAVYRYPWFVRWFAISFNVLAFVTPAFLAGSVLFRAFVEGVRLSPGAPLTVLFDAVLAGAVLVLTANFFPEVRADEEGLSVSFLWCRLPVAWQDILGIKPSFINLPGRPTTWVVRTRALTPFHRLYGLLYGFVLDPSFVVRLEIGDREDLIRKIEHRRFT